MKGGVGIKVLDAETSFSTFADQRSVFGKDRFNHPKYENCLPLLLGTSFCLTDSEDIFGGSNACATQISDINKCRTF